MKTLLTLDESFSHEHFGHIELAVFDLNKVGIYDPNFVALVKQHAQTLEAKINVEELLPKPTTKRIFVQ